MEFLNNIDFSAGADWFGAGTQAVSDAASSSDNWFSGGLDFLTDSASGAFEWLGDNPEAANLLGGVAKGAGSYLSAREASKQAEDLYDKKRRDSMISPGKVNDYGSYRTVAGRGLLTNGMLVDREDR